MTRLERRRALLIGNETYQDESFQPLPSVRADVSLLQQALMHPQIGNFTEVRPVLNCTAERMCAEIGAFLDGCEDDELVLVYISGHGTRLVQVNSEFHFVTVDTDFGDVAATGVAANFVAERFENCVAAQKIVMIDSCESGGFAIGFRTADGPSKGTGGSRPRSPMKGRGFYVLSSSRAGEDSIAGATEIAPSAFTGEVVEALCSGDAAEPHTGEVTVEGLFDYVNQRMRRRPGQIPVKSAAQVDDRIVLASRPHGRPTLTPVTRDTDPAALSNSGGGWPKAAAPTWAALISYYRKCLQGKQAAMPILSAERDRGTGYVCLAGRERFLSGAVDADHRVAMPQHARGLVDEAMTADDELWAGYPVVVLPDRGRARQRIAPLLLRRVEAISTDNGIRLQPTGRVMTHSGLINERLGEDTAADYGDSYVPSWHAGQYALMAKDIGHLLSQELELPCVQKLEPEQLADHIDLDSPTEGARNAAVLFRVNRGGSDPESRLIKDLDEIEARAGEIVGTALAALSPVDRDQTEIPTAVAPFDLVTPLPCNEVQAAVIESAMSRRLTVATGPPGTGKSQLVSNLVATAVANRQTVLVASTNNQAVDEVWQRCDGLVAGSIVRTGKREYLPRRDESLRGLLGLPAPQLNTATATGRLRHARQVVAQLRDRMGEVVATEQGLLRAGQARHTHAEALGIDIAELLERLGSVSPRTLARRARRVERARIFADRRRRRFLGKWGLSAAASVREACAALAAFADAEHSWRDNRARARALPGDTQVAGDFRAADEELQNASKALLECVVHENAQRGRRQISDLLTDDSWRVVESAMRAVPAWAVTCLSARKFRPKAGLFDLVVIDEASQCSIPYVLPLLFRARRALIIGDPMQLPHIAELDSDQEARALRAAGMSPAWLETHRMSHRRHSSFRAAEKSAGGNILLDEHFRCHPRIAELVNDLFYGGRLTVLTDIRNRTVLKDREAIIWQHVKGSAVQPDSGSWRNDAEIGKVVSSVRYLLEPGRLPENSSVGVVTPFKAQAHAIRQRLGPDFEHVRIGTVHTFQGGECDIMLYSLVAAKDMPRGSTDWIDRQLNLWNVAITRARSHLIVSGDQGLWAGRRIGSALLGAADGVSGDLSGGLQHDELRQRLFATLQRLGPVTLDEIVCGHRTDAVIRGAGGMRTAVVFDTGPGEQQDYAHHLRLMFVRQELRNDVSRGVHAMRVPAWRLFDLDFSAITGRSVTHFHQHVFARPAYPSTRSSLS